MLNLACLIGCHYTSRASKRRREPSSARNGRRPVVAKARMTLRATGSRVSCTSSTPPRTGPIRWPVATTLARSGRTCRGAGTCCRRVLRPSARRRVARRPHRPRRCSGRPSQASATYAARTEPPSATSPKALSAEHINLDALEQYHRRRAAASPDRAAHEVQAPFVRPPGPADSPPGRHAPTPSP